MTANVAGTYTYDNLNRLTGSQGTEPGSDFTNYCWSYDNWGNREQEVGSASAITGGGYSLCEPENPQPLGYSTANRVNSGPTVPTYDAAGDVTNDGTHQYLYNADGNICAVSETVQGLTTTTLYIYDADGNRVAKGITTGTGAITSCDPSSNGFTASANYVQDEAGHQLSEFDGSGNWVHTNVYANNELIATYNGVGLHFRLNDWLGTLRVQTDDAGNTELSCQSLPFGDPNTQCVNASENFFTGKERDSESGLDYFSARYYGSNMGRFMSPDPLGGHMENPQSLNKYAYALNNPLTNTDPTGLDSYLQCTQTKDNASTCQSQTVGYDSKGNAQTATVQGVTGQDGKFTATQIGNDANGNLVDKTTGTGSYTASVNGSGVQFSNNGGQTSSTGVFVNGTPQTSFQDAGFANGGALSGFNFTLTNSKLEANQTEAGSFSFNGTVSQAEAALQKAGFIQRAGTEGGIEFRSPGSGLTGANSGHFIIDNNPRISVPSSGNMHFGEHNPYSPLGWGIHIPFEVPK